MVVAVALIGLVSIVPFAFGALFLFGYISEAVQPPRQTDSFAGLLLVVGVPLMIMGGFVGLFGCLMLTRRLWSRVVYTVMICLGMILVVVFGALLSFIKPPLFGVTVLDPPYGILIASIALTWLPQSREFFTADAASTVPPVINTGYPGFTAMPTGPYYPGR